MPQKTFPDTGHYREESHLEEVPNDLENTTLEAFRVRMAFTRMLS
jgi:hypothetical protein